MAHRASFRIEFESDNPLSGSLIKNVIEKNLAFVGVRVVDAYEIDSTDMNTEPPIHLRPLPEIHDLRNVPNLGDEITRDNNE